MYTAQLCITLLKISWDGIGSCVYTAQLCITLLKITNLVLFRLLSTKFDEYPWITKFDGYPWITKFDGYPCISKLDRIKLPVGTNYSLNYFFSDFSYFRLPVINFQFLSDCSLILWISGEIREKENNKTISMTQEQITNSVLEKVKFLFIATFNS